jgi:hypothetical protein
VTNLPTKTTVSGPSMLMDAQGFDQLYRVGKMLASSILFPEHLRKGTPEQAAANGALVMNMAMRLNEDPLTVAQQIYFVGGKPGWSTSYLISKANQHGVFENPIDWEIKGKGDDLSVTAHAVLSSTKKKVSFTCDMAMAKAENWVKNPKYRTMPELMLRYRSAAALIRLYCPEVMVGVPAQIEVELGGEMRDVTPREFAHAEPDAGEADEPTDAEIVDEGEAEQAGEPETSDDDAKSKKAEADRDEAAEKKGEPDPEQFRGLLDMIKRDLADASSVDEVLELYAAQIEQMKDAAPALHEELQAEIEAYRKAAAA